MGAVSYPDKKVVDFVAKNMIPVQVRFDEQPIASDFNLRWTPTIITLDMEGKEHHRTVGFLPPEELIPSLLLGIGKAHFDNNEFKEAIESFDKILSGFPGSHSSPEAVYLRGVSIYKETHDTRGLKEACETLQSKYPGSEWAKRASPYNLL